MIDYEEYLKKLPVIPDIATRILSMPEENNDISFRDLENMIKLDPGLSTRILRVANSAMYARQKEITTLQSAITLLGYRTLKSLILLVTASSMFKPGADSEFYRYFWKHSVSTAFIAQDISIKTGQRRFSDDAFTAGLLHDIGQAAMYQYNAELFLTVKGTAMEKDVFGADHKEIGEAVLSKWNFPVMFVDTAREHGVLNITSRFKTLIIIVSTADLISGSLSDSRWTETDENRLESFMLRAGLDKSDEEHYKTQFMNSLSGNPLFAACSSLFGKLQ